MRALNKTIADGGDYRNGSLLVRNSIGQSFVGNSFPVVVAISAADYVIIILINFRLFSVWLIIARHLSHLSHLKMQVNESVEQMKWMDGSLFRTPKSCLFADENVIKLLITPTRVAGV